MACHIQQEQVGKKFLVAVGATRWRIHKDSVSIPSQTKRTQNVLSFCTAHAQFVNTWPHCHKVALR